MSNFEKMIAWTILIIMGLALHYSIPELNWKIGVVKLGLDQTINLFYGPYFAMAIPSFIWLCVSRQPGKEN